MDELTQEEVFERKHAREYAAFVRGAMRRHKALMAVVFVGIVAAAIAVVFSLPKSYHVEAKVLAHQNSALTVRGDGPGGESPIRTAAETILRRENLLSLVEQFDLVHYWRAHRSPAERARDAVLGFLSTQPDTEQDRIDAMVDRLEKRLSVSTNDNGGTVTIAIDWPDPNMACRLVDTAQQNYLESRHAQEITALAESIGILTTYARTSKDDVDGAVASVNKARSDEPKPAVDGPPLPRAPAGPPRVLVAAPRAPEGPDPRVTQIQVKIDAKKRTLEDLEDFRHRRLADLQSKLADDQAVYTESHPAVVDLKQAIAAMSSESPQVKQLRQQITALESERDELGHKRTEDSPGTARAPALAYGGFSTGDSHSGASDLLRLDADLREDRDPSMVYARGELRDAMDKYSGLRSKIQAAQIDYDTAQAAFKYRYSVVTPAHVPKRPTWPNVPLDIVAAMIAAVLAAVVLAVVVDLRSGRLVERWQLERLLDRPILGEVDIPRLPRPGPT